MKKQYETPWFDVEDIVTEQSILLPASLPTDDDGEEVGDMYGNQREEKTWGNLW
ncbi:MAG: hypothetical protein IKG99_02350 [Bacteroidaceae bacterium]|nr:hypothetical protein [Bacteroidaceae bacterium]